MLEIKLQTFSAPSVHFLYVFFFPVTLVSIEWKNTRLHMVIMSQDRLVASHSPKILLPFSLYTGMIFNPPVIKAAEE